MQQQQTRNKAKIIGKVVPKKRQALLGRRDAHEQQADMAARSYQRGDTGLAKLLTPAPAARFRHPGSAGRTLADPVRHQLEEAFSARLDAVRIHTDAAADVAARAAGSHAFVSGRDIYFAAGNYDPGHESGRELLAHEVAHVLQQTGRPASGGLLRATDVQGDGPVQCDLSDVLVDASTINALTDTQVIDLHGKLPRATRKFTAAHLSAAKKNQKQAITELVLRAPATHSKSIQKEPLQTRMVAIDLLKRHGEWISAAALMGSTLDGNPLILHPDFRTALPSKGFYQFWVKNSNTATILFKIWKEHKFFAEGRIGPKRLIESLRQYFLGPTHYDKPVPIVDLDKGFPSQMKQLADLKKGLATPGAKGLVPVHSEFFFIVLQAVHELDNVRKDALVDAEKEATAFATEFKAKDPANVVLPSNHRANVAMKFNHKINDVLVSKKGAPKISVETKFLLSDPTENVGVRMKQVSKLAHLYWTTTGVFFDKGLFKRDEKLKLDFAGGKEKATKEIFAALNKSKAGQSLKKFLTTWFADKGLLDLDNKGNLPDPDTYKTRRDLAISGLKELSAKKLPFQRTLINMFKEELVLRDARKMNDALALGVAVMLVDWLVIWLQKYDHAADKTNVAKQDKVKKVLVAAGQADADPFGADDTRILHRNEMAAFLMQIAFHVQWPKLYGKAFDLRRARHSAEDRNRLALKSNWEIDSEAGMDKIIDDFGSGYRVEGWEPFTVGDTYTFFHMLYHRTFTQAIDALITAEQKPGVNLQDPKRKQLMLQAHARAEAMERPKRWHVKHYDFNVRRSAPAGVTTWGQLILGHWKTVLMIHDLDKRKKKFVVPKHRGGVFMWIIPPVPKLVKRLRDELKLPEKYKDKKKLDWFEWWKWVSRQAKVIGLSTGHGTEVAKFRTKLGEDQKATFKAFVAASRRATTHERTIANVRIAKLLNAFKPGGSAIEKVSPKGYPEMFNMEVPDKIILEMDNFVFKNSYPYEDWPYHLAAMFLENATLFESKLNPKTNKWSMGKRRAVGLALSYLSRLQFALDISAATTATSTQMPKAKADELKKRRGEFRDILTDGWKKDPTHLKNARKKLVALVSGLQTSMKDMQTSAGIQGYKSQSASSKVAGNVDVPGVVRTIGVGSSNVIKAGDSAENEMLIDGRTWRVIEVREDFTYHPPVNLKTAGRKATASEPSGESVLIVNGKKLDKKNRHIPLLVLNIQDSDSNTIVYGDNDALLSEFMHVAQMWGVVKGLEATAAAIKQGFMFALEVAEFIPGPGWIAMAVRMFAGIMSFLESADFQDLTKVVQGLPKDLPAFVKEKLAKVDAAHILEFMLFADTSALAGLQPAAKSKPKKRVGKRGKLTRFVKNLSSLGGLFLSGLGRIQTRVRHKTDAVGLFLMSHPNIARAAGWAVDNIERLRSGVNVPDMPGPKDLAKVKEMFETQIPSFLNGLGEVELPNDLIPLPTVVEAVIELAVKTLGKKAELIAEGLIWGLKNAPGNLYGRLVAAISERLTTAGFDPNIIWRNAVKTHGNQLVNNAYEQFRNDYNDFFNGISILNVQKLKAKKLEITLVKGMDASSPAFSGDKVPGKLPAVAPELPRGGRPLDLPTRMDAEHRFGHDLGHVRLHTGAGTAALTSSLGVDGLTSGSNVYLRPGLSPQSGEGSRVFRHELTHVLQQTGSRPLGGRYSSFPQRGTPAKGLRYEPGQEAEADRIAGQVARGPARSPVRVGTGGGMQPSGLLTRLFDKLTSFVDLEESAEKHEKKSKPGKLPRGLSTKVNKTARHMYQNTYKIISSSKLDGDQPFKKAKDEIRTQLNRSEFIQTLELVLPRLAMDAQVLGKAPKGTTQSGKKKSKPKLLDHKAFRDNLTRYIFARSGVLLQIGVKKKNKDGEPQRIDITSVKIEYVHLPLLHGNHKFWTLALTGVVAKKDRAKMLPRIRSYLISEGPRAGIWVKSAFRLNKKVVKDTEAWIAAGGKKLLDPKLLPSKKDYKKDKGPSTHIGLRLGTYTSPNQKATERESHHITQFLLLEYFAHKSGKKPFALLKGKQAQNKYKGKDLYPGLKMSGTALESFSGITIKTLVANRGGQMPTISLAKGTHRRGKLHVSSAADDFPGSTVKSQGDAIHAVFEKKLVKQDKDLLKAQKTLKDFGDHVKNKTSTVVEKKIYNAMQQTYKWMRDFMQLRLQRALKSIEKKYYNDLAQQAKLKDRLNNSELDTVFNGAVAHNKKLLEAKGWTAKNK